MRTDFSNNPLVKHCIEFALMIIRQAEVLESNKKYVIAKQLLKCGTSMGANVMEAQSAESKADFLHKLKIADKEAHETGIGCICAMNPKGIHWTAQYKKN